MEKKLPDSYVPDRYIKSYPTEIGSQPFEPDNIELFKLEKSNRLKHHYTTKFDEIKLEYEKLMNDISIIIPIFNEALSLNTLLNCISNQSISPKEVIFVDSGSTDSSNEIITNFINNNHLDYNIYLYNEKKRVYRICYKKSYLFYI